MFVNIPVLNLYVEPNETSEVVSQALYGWPIEIIETKTDFSRIYMSDGYEGWVRTDALCAPSYLKEGPKAKIIHNAAHVYFEPTVTRRKPILTLPFEVHLTILNEPEEEEFRWIQVLLVDGRSGWIQRGNIQINPKSLNLSQMLVLSQQFLGLPYTWGGSSSFGYDCSGYTQMLFRQMGRNLPRDARQQASSHLFEKVELADLEEGDLLFFGSNPDAIKHVAIYLGCGRLVHASVKPIPIVHNTTMEDESLKARFSFLTACRLKMH